MTARDLYGFEEGVSLAEHSSFRIGGEARYACFPSDASGLADAVARARESGMRYVVIGKGSNILFADEGYDGIVIITSKMKNIELVGDKKIVADAGVSLPALCRFALKNGLGGAEFLYGIPGTVGGAIFMNAGAFGGEISQITDGVTAYSATRGGMVTPEDNGFGYRRSIYQSDPELTIVKAEFSLEPGEPDEISSRMEDYVSRRRLTQPLEYPSAGSSFKRPEGHFAGKLIEDAGLKGYRIGGAEVSKKHAGFIINRGGATARDVLELMEYVKNTVSEKFGVSLEPEIRYID